MVATAAFARPKRPACSVREHKTALRKAAKKMVGLLVRFAHSISSSAFRRGSLVKRIGDQMLIKMIAADGQRAMGVLFARHSVSILGRCRPTQPFLRARREASCLLTLDAAFQLFIVRRAKESYQRFSAVAARTIAPTARANDPGTTRKYFSALHADRGGSLGFAVV
jgi:hypothetical protein